MKHIKKFNENVEDDEVMGAKLLEPFFTELNDTFDVTIEYDGETNVSISMDFASAPKREGIKLEGGMYDYSYDEVAIKHTKLAEFYLALKKIAKKIEAETIYQTRLFPSNFNKLTFIVFRKDV